MMLCWKFRGTEVPVGTVTGPRANAGSGGLEACPWFAGESVITEGARVVPTAKNTSSWHGLQLCTLSAITRSYNHQVTGRGKLPVPCHTLPWRITKSNDDASTGHGNARHIYAVIPSISMRKLQPTASQDES